MTNPSIVNIDTVKFRVNGMKFEIPGAEQSVWLTPTGEVKNINQNRVPLHGKFEAHDLLVSSPDSGRSLIVEGALAGFLYGQNVFTSNDMHELVIRCLKRVCEDLEIDPAKELKRKWVSGDVTIEKADLAVNFDSGTELLVKIMLKQIRRQLIEHDFAINGHGTTVILRPSEGRDTSLSFYAKHAQMRRSKRYDQMIHKKRLLEACEALLRAEVRILRTELAKNGCGKLSDWNECTAIELFAKYFKRYDFLKITYGELSQKELDALPSRLRPVLALHKSSGIDLAMVYEERTLQRHQADFRKLGIDLGSPNMFIGQPLDLSKALSKSKAVTAPKWIIDAGLAPKGDDE